MVSVISGSGGHDIRVGSESGMVQFWVVPKGTRADSSDGWLVLIPPALLRDGLPDGQYDGESWHRKRRSMTITRSGERTSVRVHTPTDSSGLGTTVNSAEFDAAVAECLDDLG